MREQYYSTSVGFSVGGIDMIDVIRGEGFRYSFYQKKRPKNAFIYVVRGSLKYAFPNPEEAIFIKAGDVLFVPAGSEYAALYLENQTHIRIVQFDLFGNDFPRYLKSAARLCGDGICEVVNSFFEEKNSATLGASLYFLSKMYELLWLIEEQYSDMPKKYQKLNEALRLITSDLCASHKVADYARLSNMSEVNFRRAFREYTGTSPVDYRNDLRLIEARKKLQSGEYNVTEAANSVGFTNLSFFIRLYKKKFGTTPKRG